jgi:cysteine desulfurase/selenocysteine lyase
MQVALYFEYAIVVCHNEITLQKISTHLHPNGSTSDDVKRMHMKVPVMTAQLDVKSDFGVYDIYPELAYFDSVSTTLVPKKAIKATTVFLNTIAVSSRRGAYRLAVMGNTLVENVRTSLADFMNTDKSQISFHESIPAIVASLAYGYGWHREDRNRILVAQSEEHSILTALMRVAEVLGLDVGIIPIDATGSLQMERLKELVNRKTGIVAVGQVTPGIGARNPINEVAEIAHENGAILVTDATRSIGITNTPPQSLGADVLIFSGNIGLMGPPGLAVQWIDEALGAILLPGIIGGSAVANVTTSSYDIAMQPDKFESGTINVPAIVGLGAAIDYLRSLYSRGFSSHLKTLSRYMLERLTSINDVFVYGLPDENSTVFGFNVGHDNAISCHDVSLFLDQSNVAVRSGLLCAHPLVRLFAEEGIVQASLYVYNSLDDIDRLADSLKLIRDQLM